MRLDKPLVDHRIYTIALRQMDAFLDVFDRLAMPVLLETLGTPLGIHVSQVGPLNQVVHLWAYENLADYERRCRLRDTHPDGAAGAARHILLPNVPKALKPGGRMVSRRRADAIFCKLSLHIPL